MNKLDLLRKRLVIFLLVFSFILGIFPLGFGQETVYAEKKKLGVLVFTDDTYFYQKNFAVSDDTKVAIVKLFTGAIEQQKLEYKGAIEDLAKNCSNVVVIIDPIMANGSGKTGVTQIRWNESQYNEVFTLIEDSTLKLQKRKVVKKIIVYGAEGVLKPAQVNDPITAERRESCNHAEKLNTALSAKFKKKNYKKTVFLTPSTTYSQTDRGKVISDKYISEFNTLKGRFYYDPDAAKNNKKDDEDNKSTNALNTEDMLKAIGASTDEKTQKRVEAYAQYLLGEGYSEAATAGILANMRAESGFNPLSAESGSDAGGLFGFDPITNFSNSKFNNDCGDSKGSVHGYQVCSDGKCQIYYTLDALKKAIDSNSNRIKNANKFFSNITEEDKKPDKYTAWGKNLKLPDKIDYVKNLDEFKKLKDPTSAAGVFSICFEVCAGTFEPCNLPINKSGSKDYHSPHPNHTDKTWHDFMLHEWNVNSGRLSYAEPIYEWLTGKAFKNADTSGAQEMAKEAAKKGYLTEEELSAWTKIINEKFINYKEITRDSLSQSELSSLAQWENNVGYDDLSSHGIFKVFRIAFMILAIMMMIWAVLMYCAYWLDRTTPFDLGFSALSIVTFHKLEAAPTDEECNYNVKGFFKEHKDGAKFINHRYMLIVCITLIGFAVLILTGTIYKVLLGILGFVYRFFG